MAIGAAAPPPPLGQHIRTVATTEVPYRFVDEMGAQIAAALAMAVVRGMVSETPSRLSEAEAGRGWRGGGSLAATVGRRMKKLTLYTFLHTLAVLLTLEAP